jgi:four helix bundle protein
VHILHPFVRPSRFDKEFVGAGDGTLHAYPVRMAKTHKDLICWHLAAQLRGLVLTHTRTGAASKDFGFREQIRRAARSACYQTSEGFYFFKHKIFAHYLNGAYASLGELLDQVDDGHEQKYFTAEQHVEMRRLARRAMKANRRLAEWLLTHPDPVTAPGTPPRRRRGKIPAPPAHSAARSASGSSTQAPRTPSTLSTPRTPRT